MRIGTTDVRRSRGSVIRGTRPGRASRDCRSRRPTWRRPCRRRRDGARVEGCRAPVRPDCFGNDQTRGLDVRQAAVVGARQIDDLLHPDAVGVLPRERVSGRRPDRMSVGSRRDCLPAHWLHGPVECLGGEQPQGALTGVAGGRDRGDTGTACARRGGYDVLGADRREGHGFDAEPTTPARRADRER